MKRVLRNCLKWGVPILIIVIMMVWLGGHFHRGMIRPGKVEAAATSALGVPLYTVTAQTSPQIAEAVGAVAPQFKTTISARVTANVIALPVNAGQYVHQGDLLVRLDARDLQARMQQAREALRRAEASRDLAQIGYDRDKPLVEKAVIPKSDFDEDTEKLKTATADVASFQQVRQDADVTLGYAVIHSPYDGVVIDKLSDVGDLAAPGKPLLTMYESGKMWLEAAVPEEEIGSLHIGQTYSVRIDALNKQLTGRLVEIVPSADPSSRTITARVTIPYVENLIPGIFGRMRIPVGQSQEILIPQAAVLRVGQLTMVDVAENGTLRRRSLQLGRNQGDQVEVLSGLMPGEKIALTPRKELNQ